MRAKRTFVHHVKMVLQFRDLGELVQESAGILVVSNLDDAKGNGFDGC